MGLKNLSKLQGTGYPNVNGVFITHHPLKIFPGGGWVPIYFQIGGSQLQVPSFFLLPFTLGREKGKIYVHDKKRSLLVLC